MLLDEPYMRTTADWRFASIDAAQAWLLAHKLCSGHNQMNEDGVGWEQMAYRAYACRGCGVVTLASVAGTEVDCGREKCG